MLKRCRVQYSFSRNWNDILKGKDTLEKNDWLKSKRHESEMIVMSKFPFNNASSNNWNYESDGRNSCLSFREINDENYLEYQVILVSWIW